MSGSSYVKSRSKVALQPRPLCVTQPGPQTSTQTKPGLQTQTQTQTQPGLQTQTNTLLLQGLEPGLSFCVRAPPGVQNMDTRKLFINDALVLIYYIIVGTILENLEKSLKFKNEYPDPGKVLEFCRFLKSFEILTQNQNILSLQSQCQIFCHLL